MCRPSKIDSRCVDLRCEIRLLQLLAQNIDTNYQYFEQVAVAVQCFHCIGDESVVNLEANNYIYKKEKKYFYAIAIFKEV